VSPSAVQVKGIADATALFGGISHTCVIGKKGNVSCWGANDHGQIGDGTKENRPTPIGVKGVENAKQLALGVHVLGRSGRREGRRHRADDVEPRR
jgi:alpha-tubulin suppressor-like RCC1 family protein